MGSRLVKIEDIGALRAKLRSNPQYRMEILAAVVSVSRHYNVVLEDVVVQNLTLADEAELEL
jgi:hypothetical protein